ncbi:hypothetical protein METP2_02948 [Methanosarcinales archaeon]|nr:hypothetical protein METP2_02948 [Methanosarcinales archaeon]
MTWKNSDGIVTGNPFQYPLQAFKINEQCFIRKGHKCGKLFGASRSCFIACPSKDDIEPILEIASMKLNKEGIEPIIAVRDRAYGQDIFCTKICGKIIESKFCIVILDDSIVESKSIPNPNVYYEYGLMTSLEKHIIPLQKDDLKLAFNIQSYDTIKYNHRNIGAELDRAIKDAIKITESKEQTEKKYVFPERSILRRFELAGLLLKDEKWFLHEMIDDTNFKGFGRYNIDFDFYVFLGKIDELNEIQVYLEDLNVILYRIEKLHQDLKDKIKVFDPENMLSKHAKHVFNSTMYGKFNPMMYGNKSKAFNTADFFEQQFYNPSEEEQGLRQYSEILKGYGAETSSKLLQKEEDRREELTNKYKLISIPMYIGFIINPEIQEKNRSDFINKAQKIVSLHKNFDLVQDRNGEIVFGKVKVGLHSI